MNKYEMNKKMNAIRYEVLDGHGILLIVDHIKNTITEYKQISKEENIDTYDKVENTYLTNGWKHLRRIEDCLNQDEYNKTDF